ncbi:hypothetical protein BD310DRAFT_908893, partial [Dichomitus squalens]
IVNITPKRKRAWTETVWAPAKKSCAECKEKRTTCLFFVGRLHIRTCQACARSKTKCTGGQRADKTPAIVISDDEAPAATASPSTLRKKVALAEKAGPVPESLSKARGKKRETTAEREERLEAERRKAEIERRKAEIERREKEIDMTMAPMEADLPFSRRAWREITVLKTLCYAVSEIWQFQEEMEVLWREMCLTCGVISDLAQRRERVYKEYFGGIANLLEGEPSDDEGHLESDPDWAEMEEFGMAEPDWEPGLEPGLELGSEVAKGREQEVEKRPEWAQE